MRHSDTTGLKYDTMSMESYGLTADLVRTKTTGPGKKVKVVKLFVSKAAYLRAGDWLQVGWDLWQQMSRDAGIEHRDYFLPYPRARLDGCLPRMAKYAAASAMSNAAADYLEVEFEGVAVRLLEHGVLVRAFGAHHDEKLGESGERAGRCLQEAGSLDAYSGSVVRQIGLHADHGGAGSRGQLHQGKRRQSGPVR